MTQTSTIRKVSKLESVPFKVFEPLFYISLFIFPLLLGAVNLWSFAIGAVFLCGAFSVYWFSQLSDGRLVPRTQLDTGITVYLIFFLLSLVFSKIHYFSWIELYKLIVVLCAFLATRYLCRQRLQVYRLSKCLVFLGALYSMIGLLQFVGGLPKDWWNRSYFLSSVYVNHNHFAGLLNLILPISLGFVFAERDASKRALFLFLSVLMGVALVFTLSRGALVSFCVSMVFMILVLRKKRLVFGGVMPWVLFVGLVAGAVLIFGTASLEQRVGDIQRMTAEEQMSLKVRWFTWQGTLPMIRHFFWLGSGPGTFAHLFLQFRPVTLFSWRPVYALNDLLQLFAECGIFTFLAATYLTVIFFRKGLGIIRMDDSRLRIGVGSGILAGVLGLLVHGLFNFNFHIPANWLLSSVAAGLLFSMDENRFYDSEKLSGALKTLISLILLGVFVASFYLGVSHYHFWEAKALLADKQRRAALEVVQKSLQLNPYDAESYYLRGLIRLLEKDKASIEDFDEAIRRNRYEPVYDMAKARALGSLFSKMSPSELVAVFKKGIDKDPNNQELAFMTARDTFSGSAQPSSALREQAWEMLEQRQETLNGLVAFLEKKDLWQYHRKYYLKLLAVHPDVDKTGDEDLWKAVPDFSYNLSDFSSLNDQPVSHEEFFFRNGELFKKINISNPSVQITLSMKGSAVNGVWPVLYVKIDGKLVDEYYVNSKVYKKYRTKLTVAPGAHVLSLQYANDLCVGNLPSQDRNVWIQKIELQSAEVLHA